VPPSNLPKAVTSSDAAGNSHFEVKPPVAMAATSNTVQGFITPDVVMAAASDAAQGVVLPDVAIAIASDAVQGFIMPQVATAAASDADQGVVLPDVAMATASDDVQGVVMPEVATAAASDAIQGVVIPEVAMAAAFDAVQGVNTLHIASSAVSSASKAAQRATMHEIAASVAPGVFQGVNTPKTATTTASGAVRLVTVNSRTRYNKYPASALKSFFMKENLDDSYFEGKVIRQAQPGQLDEKGKDLDGKIQITDGVCAFTGDSAATSLNWVKNKKNVNKEIAPSLTYVICENVSVMKIGYKYSNTKHSNIRV